MGDLKQFNVRYLFICVVDDDQISSMFLTVFSADVPGQVKAGENIETAVAFYPLLWQIYKDIFYNNVEKEVKVCGLTENTVMYPVRCTFTYL